ncbi:MAG: hypothetical protein MMC33_009548 [Icmadophila ericetorum]|nr:hypothetical protein [Icmadophila ericetorum]
MICAACCQNSDYFVWPDTTRLAQPFDIGETIDTIYVVETANPNGVSTDCECGNGYIYSHFAQNVVQGSWQGFLANGTAASFGNPNLMTNCASASSTSCNLTLHSTDGQGENGWGSTLAILPGLSLQYSTGGSQQGTLPVPLSTATATGGSPPTDTGSFPSTTEGSAPTDTGSFPSITTTPQVIEMSTFSQFDNSSTPTFVETFSTPTFAKTFSIPTFAKTFTTPTATTPAVLGSSLSSTSPPAATQTANAASGLANPVKDKWTGTIASFSMIVILYQSWFLFFL